MVGLLGEKLYFFQVLLCIFVTLSYNVVTCFKKASGVENKMVLFYTELQKFTLCPITQDLRISHRSLLLSCHPEKCWNQQQYQGSRFLLMGF